MGYRYLGEDPKTDWLPGIPARDLYNEEVDEFPQLAELMDEDGRSRLYAVADLPAPRSEEMSPGSDDEEV